MSDIPRARNILIDLVHFDKTLSRYAKRRINLAIQLTYRVEYVRRAPAKRKVIDKYLRLRIKYLARANPNMTMHEIANIVGLRSSGRISDVLHGKR